MDPRENDQRWFMRLYLNNTRSGAYPRLALDHDTRVFLTMTFRELAADLVYSPADRSWRHAVTGNAPAVVHYPGWIWRKQHVQTWHLLNGANNLPCGLLMCLPVAAGWALLGAGAAGAALGLAWTRLLGECRLGRAVMTYTAESVEGLG